jgi:hypothetical protein
MFDRRKTQEQSIEGHLEEIRGLMKEHLGVTKAVTILIDESSGTWRAHPVYCNTTNGDVFMALKIVEHRLVAGVEELK